MQSHDDRWLLPLTPGPARPALRLFCFPYAGGGPDLFRSWQGALRAEVELVAVRLPGRGSRIKERPYSEWEPLLRDTFEVLAPYLAEPHAFYGHSFGGRLAYELTQLAEAAHPGRTRHLFISACRSPDQPQLRPYLHQLSEPDFRDALLAMGGTPAEVLQSEALMRLMLPALRNDMRLSELWGDRHGHGITTPLTALCGRDDPIDNLASMSGWQRFARGRYELLEIAGGHFFLESHRQDLLEVIDTRLGGCNG